MDDDLNEYADFEASQQPHVNRDIRRVFRPTLWPPAATENLGLERCMRFYPQLQDTGVVVKSWKEG